MRLAIFESELAAGLEPVAWVRPVFELLTGHFSPRERWLKALQPDEWGALVRPHLVDTYREAAPDAYVNDPRWLAGEPTLLINGQWLCDPSAIPEFNADYVGIIDGEIAWIVCDPLEAGLLSDHRLDDTLASLAQSRKRVAAAGQLIRRPWDLVGFNDSQIRLDHTFRQQLSTGDSPRTSAPLTIIGPAGDVHVDPTAKIDPFVVFDATGGPIYIDRDAVIQAFTRIEGPCYVGPGTQLFRTNLRAGSSFGPMCRVGGEIENSVLQGFSNKYHDGFLGHSYVGSWVNLGAITTNSDLKNDYSSVSVPIGGTSIATGEKKIGCFLADHVKTGLGSLFNTGTAVGLMSMILPAGELLPKHIPSFSRLWHGELQELPSLEPSLETAAIAMGRRGQNFTIAQERLLRSVWHLTKDERQKAFSRQAGVSTTLATTNLSTTLGR